MRYSLFFIFHFSFFIFLPAYANAENFLIDKKFDKQDRELITADALHAGRKSIFFVEREYYNSLPPSEGQAVRGAIEYVMKEFEEKIYSQLREVFGSERTPGLDGDEKIKIILHQMKDGVGGYVRKSDMYQKSLEAESNEGEIIYININDLENRSLAPAYLAHEFQHLITMNQKTTRLGLEEEQWLNEARSEYAPTILGYNDIYEGSYLKRRVDEFLAHPSDALLDWQGKSVDHASASMFTHYLVDRYGVQVLTKMMEADTIGVASINEALGILGHKEDFNEIFRDWILAVYVNGSVGGEERFKYKRSTLSFGNLHVLPASAFRMYDNNSQGASFIIDNWSGQWHRFVPGALGEETTLHIRFSSVEKDGFFFPAIVSDFFGGAEIKLWDLSKGNIFSIDGFGKEVSSVVVAPVLASGNAGGIFPSSLSRRFSLEGFVSNSFVSRFAEGALIRSKGDTRVYVVKNSPKIGEVFMRWIPNEEVFGFYKHLSWNDIVDMKSELLNNFKESFLIRKTGDYKIYEFDKLGRKKWLDMTPAEFEKRGYKWEAVYEVNEAEFHWFLDS